MAQLGYLYASAAVLLFLTAVFLIGMTSANRLAIVIFSAVLVALTTVIQVRERVVFDYVAGAFSPLSAAFWVYAVSAVSAFAFRRPLFQQKDEFVFCLVVYLSTLLVYTDSFGYSGLDLFSLGYHWSASVAVAFSAGVLSLLTRSAMLPLWLALAALLKLAGVVDTNNIFVYLLDPVGLCTSACLLIAHLLHRWTGRIIPFPGRRLSARPG